MSVRFEQELQDRLLRYTAIDSQSDAGSTTQPSTAIQHDMLHLLRDELTKIGATDVRQTEYGAVLATIPGTADGPTIGLLAHVDTAPAFHATGVKPVVHSGYNGGDITFADAPDLKLSPENSPHLAEKLGHDIITASGTTLLGADDKAGVAIIMAAARHLLANPDILHAPIGVDQALPGDLGADFAYTFDGASLGNIEYESFSADGALISIKGVSTHPGDAKDKLVNAAHLAAKVISLLDQPGLTPETTEGREGFIHITDITGGAAETQITLILRDFERDGLATKGVLVEKICAAVNASEPRAQITCEITPQYRNMRYWLENDMGPVELAYAATRAVGIAPVSNPIRGGTDGSRLTEMGVPTPNIFTGMQEIHGPLEWISVQDMNVATNMCLELVKQAAT